MRERASWSTSDGPTGSPQRQSPKRWIRSAAILSDAAESVVHVVAVAYAAYSLRVTERPADDCHLYGHAKIGFFSAGFEGALIAAAALYIIYEAISKWLIGLELQHLGIGTCLTAFAALINGALGGYLVWIGYFSVAMLACLLAIPSLRRIWAIYQQPRPESPPEGLPEGVWPLYFVAGAFWYTRRFGAFFLIGLIADVALSRI